MIVRPIVADTPNNCRAQATDITFQNLQSFAVAIASNDDSPVLHKLREVSRFAARRRTRIKDCFSSLRIEKLTGDCCTGILNVAMTDIESGRWQSIEFHEI